MVVLAIQHPASVPGTCQSLEASFVPRSLRLGPIAGPPGGPRVDEQEEKRPALSDHNLLGAD